MKKLFALLLALVLFFPVLAGAETVVTSFYPVWLLTRSLTDGIDGLNVVNLAENVSGCLHDYSLQTSDMAVLSGADALLVNGAGMESFLPVITSAYPDLPGAKLNSKTVLLPATFHINVFVVTVVFLEAAFLINADSPAVVGTRP